jgi:tetratricopeptide (TPR) repeat protein
MPEIEAPEIELDDDAPTFRRRLALAVVLITLFGAIVAYLHESNSNLEDNAAREAQIASIKGFGQQVGASTEFQSNYRVFVQKQLLERRHLVAAARQRSTLDQSQSSLYGADSDRWTKVRDAVGQATQVQDDKGATALNSTLQAEPDKARLTQKVFANKANDYGNKADSYVALLTVLAVGLFLIGLSLTVSGRARYFLATPGVAIAIVCVGWALLITTTKITQVSPNAIDLTAQGQTLQNNGDAKGAIDKYHAAIADSPQFGAAYARLADAEFEAGAVTSTAGNQFQSLSDPEATKRAIAAGEKAISLGESGASLLSDIGFFHFAIGDYDRAAALSQDALQSDDQFPPLIFNLGVAQVGQGDAAGAEDTYRRGIEQLAKEQDNGLRQQIIAAARTDLEIAVDHTPDRKDLAQKMKGLLAEAEAPILDSTDQAPEGAPANSSVSDIQIQTDRFRLFASYKTDGYDDNTPLSNVWYFRPLDRNGQGPFEQIFPLDRSTLTGSGTVATEPVENGDCLPGGDYRVEVYAGHDLVGTADQHIPDSALGTLTVDGGEDVGFTMCHPQSWTPPPVTFQPGSLAFANPKDPSQFVLVFSFPIGAGSGASGTALLNATIQNAIATQQITVDGTPEAGDELLGRTVDGVDVTLATTSITGTSPLGDKVRITGSVGTDDVVRIVIISAANSSDLDIVRGELVNSVRFLRVPPS